MLIIGAGPGGLRTAIEALCLGAYVTVAEKRRYMSRHNVLVLWKDVVDELYSLGLKEFYKQFGTGSSEELCIRRLQLMLTKLALILGATLKIGCEFVATARGSIFAMACTLTIHRARNRGLAERVVGVRPPGGRGRRALRSP